ncbi:MAG: flagellin FliC [Bdellovibrionaceae bacterium]|nr:flagellin FliC [Pseudobdellovibrionaceae bacterium]|tara:strand:- start:1026 stop:1859 length:834 start_codon:yes stop_codon:yes gene_type:complete
MGLRINTNITAINAQRQMRNTRMRLDKSLERLASGSRINHAGDDAAGLAISENLRAQIRGMKQAKRNANDGVSLIQVSEGGLNEIANILIRLRELSIQAASDTIGDTERQFIDREYQSLKQEVDRIANVTSFNGTPLLNGKAGIFEIQVGVHNNPILDRIIYNGERADASLDALKLGGESVATKQGAQLSLSVIDDALIRVNSIRADLGAMQNRLQSTINNLAINEENLAAANSRIRDTDVAQEVSELTKQNILMNAGISVLGHANSTNQAATKLLG